MWPTALVISRSNCKVGSKSSPYKYPPSSLHTPAAAGAAAARVFERHFYISGFCEILPLIMASIISRSAKHFHFANRCLSLHRLRLQSPSSSCSVLAGANLHDPAFPYLHSVGFLIGFELLVCRVEK